MDMMSLYCNLLFLTMFSICLIREEEYFRSDLMHIIGAYACFFMWIKIFYWMRLFSSLAYYVKLIYQTIADISAFMLMVLIILTSFGCFLYVCNRNLTGRKASYLGVYFGNEFIDSILSIYMIGALGNFTPSRFRTGYGNYFVMFMFLMSTFFVSVIFMNMLISVMGYTYGNVQDGAV